MKINYYTLTVCKEDKITIVSCHDKKSLLPITRVRYGQIASIE